MQSPSTTDQLFLIAESLAQDFSLFRDREQSNVEDHVRGLLPRKEVARRCAALDELDIDAYIERCVSPAGDPGRMAAPAVIAALGGRIRGEQADGPFYSAIVTLDFGDDERDVGFIAQDRRVRNGEWMPEHHLAAARRVDEFSRRSMPIVSLMDTPGAAADEAANARNQAHSISRLIAEMCNVDVPNIGLILGLGYSGGAIPLAASNLILSVRDGVFNTIQPPGLASIARKYNLSWQECAKQVGVSAYELYMQGNVDGIIDFVPGEDGEHLENFRSAIVTGILSIEEGAREFVADNPYIIDHYRHALQRYVRPAEQQQRFETSASLALTKSPTEFTNVFGVTYRYLRYLGVRRRIKATSTSQYGRLAVQETPRGQLASRAERERQASFLRWLQDPERIAYDDVIAKAWRNYQDKKQAVHDERGRIAQLIFGEPRKNYEDARTHLITSVGMYLYNRWKGDAAGHLAALHERLENHRDTRRLLRVTDLEDPLAMRRYLALGEAPFARYARQRFGYAGRRLFGRGAAEMSESAVRSVLTAEINMLLTGDPIAADELFAETRFSARTQRLMETGASRVAQNRSALNDLCGDMLAADDDEAAPVPFSEMTVMDVLLEDGLRQEYIIECENLMMFDEAYDQIIAQLDTVAEEARETRAFSQETVTRLLDKAMAGAAARVFSGQTEEQSEARMARLREQFMDWFQRVTAHPGSDAFFRAVEEWKKSRHPYLSDALLVVVTFYFERLLPALASAESGGRRFQGRIAPRNIGRRKDFWNRLAIAYRDLLIQQTLNEHKRRGVTGPDAFIDHYFESFEELYGDLLSSDPVHFPGFRQSIEDALERGKRPAGTVTGIGEFRTSGGTTRVGAVISNVEFQAGAFDMASAEKFCKLLVECVRQSLPVVCFISSGGMQTKEGAGALFSMAAVNDRITRFVRDQDLPVIVFGFGDCTGGAQASFVTHPLVQTYYLSGTDMPFAGQIVVSSNLPFTCRLSNYLSLTPGAMQGLVKHPFHHDLDDVLKDIDPEIPLPAETVEEVVARVLSGSFAAAAPLRASVTPLAPGAGVRRPVKRVLIHARGCTAVKLIRVAQRLDIEVVLVQSDPDMDSVAVDMLGDDDVVVCIGGNTPDESYLNAMSVVRVAEDEGADALHPGIGFLSESASFAELCVSHGINFVGPSVASMDTMGNKSNAINKARSLDVPVVPGSHGILTDPERAAEVADDIGYPVLIKAVHGGGGKGIQVVESPEQFAELFHQVRAEAASAFGNGDVYLEKFVQRLRHIEVQVLRDTHGNTRVLGLRDCSVQRNKQKVVEESASTMLPAHLQEQALDYTRRLADGIDYEGAGTVEFIYDIVNEAVYFMEMNTRLQVEHPVTEKVSGVDIVAQQFRIAGGESIADVEPAANGHAIEVRINAERAFLNSAGRLQFRPDPGEITLAELPEAEGIDVISTAATGKVVSPFYDSMVAQIIAHDVDREAAIERLLSYLERVRIEGIATNIPIVKRVLADERFRAGEFDTGFLDDMLTRIDVEALLAEQGPGASIDADAIRIDDSDELKVLSPSTGIFYITPSPTEPEYVAPGQVISVNDTLCQIEAMKVFTPLALKDFNRDAALYDPKRKYRVTRVNQGNAQQVSAGDLLFVVKPE